MRLLPALLSPCLALLAACGGGGSVSGTVHGASLSFDDAVSTTLAIPDNGAGEHAALIALSSSGGLCGDLGANVARKHEAAMLIELVKFDDTGAQSAPTAPGTYTIYTDNGSPPAMAATLHITVLDGACQDTPSSDARAMTGTVTLTSVTGDVYAGTFDVMLDSGDHLTGSFDPDACAALATAQMSDTPPTCK